MSRMDGKKTHTHTSAAFSLNGEYVLRSFLPNGVFLPCGRRLDFLVDRVTQAYRWRSLPRFRRHRASSPQVSSSNGFCLWMAPWTNQYVCFLPIHSGHQVRWTYQPGSHRRKVTQDFFHPPSFCGAFLNFSREKDSAIPFFRRP